MATSSEQRDAYAVVRLDSFRNWTPRPENVTVRRIVDRLVDAELEVRQLNALAPTGTVYFIQRTTVVREAAPRSSAPVAPVAVAVVAPPSPRSRKARAERKAAKTTKKKSKRK